MKNKQNKKVNCRKKGFSLAEVVVAMALISIISIAAITIVRLAIVRMTEDLDYTKARIAAENFLVTGDVIGKIPIGENGQYIYTVYDSELSRVTVEPDDDGKPLTNQIVGRTQKGKELFRIAFSYQP